MKIAVTFPGKIGDCLYSLPTAKKIATIHNCKVDFYTSSYCEGLRELIQYQPYVDNFYISPDYQIKRWDMGIQPWQMPVLTGYDQVYHLGYRSVPNTRLDYFIARQLGLEPVESISYNFVDYSTLEEPYVILAPHNDKRYMGVFKEFVERCPLPVMIVGTKDEYPGFGGNLTGLNFLDELPWMAHATAFIGVSAHLVLAEGFPILKIIPHDGHTFDMNHLIYDEYHVFPINPTVTTLLRMVTNTMIYSKTLDPGDYEFLGGYAKHIDNVVDHFKYVGGHYRFEHQHRKWEYALAYKVLDETNSKVILDVGGGGSIFAPAMEWVGKSVLQVDPGEVNQWIESQRKATGKPLPFIQQDFMEYPTDLKYDAVTCLSVIEHVVGDDVFFKKLLQNVKVDGVLILTTDFHESGEARVSGHIRTYNAESLEKLIKLAEEEGFESYNGYDYSNSGYYVNGCNFASLVLVNKGKKTYNETTALPTKKARKARNG